MINGDRVSYEEDRESRDGYWPWLHNNENGLYATELCTLKWVRRSILYFVYVTSIIETEEEEAEKEEKDRRIGKKTSVCF